MPRAVLIGPPGSGKSTVAGILASQWGVSVKDTDDEVVTLDGRDIPTIFLEDGEAGFRHLERSVVERMLRTHDGVLALGGGAVLDPQTQDDLTQYIEAGGEVIYLSVEATQASSRVGLEGSRPLLVGNVHRRWVTLMEERRGIYERLATLTIPTDALDPDGVANTIAQARGTT